MARVLKEQRSLNSAYKQETAIGVGFALIGLGIIVFFSETWFAGAVFIILGIVIVCGGDKFRVGAIGEKRVAEVLSSFPDDWYIFNDVVVHRSQIDHVVISPKGVYTVETKNYRGTIYGNAEKDEWLQVIEGYRTAFYNPVKQAIRHSLSLKKWLTGYGFGRVWVNTIVVFTEPNVELKVFSRAVPVIHVTKMRELLDGAKKILASDECSRIADIVCELVPVKDRKNILARAKT